MRLAEAVARIPHRGVACSRRLEVVAAGCSPRQVVVVGVGVAVGCSLRPQAAAAEVAASSHRLEESRAEWDFHCPHLGAEAAAAPTFVSSLRSGCWARTQLKAANDPGLHRKGIGRREDHSNSARDQPQRPYEIGRDQHKARDQGVDH